MHKTCVRCGRAYCSEHLIASISACHRCAERCSNDGCNLVSTKQCVRCQASLCVSHRNRPNRRCERCEASFAREFATSQNLALSRQTDSKLMKPRKYLPGMLEFQIAAVLALAVVSGEGAFLLVFAGALAALWLGVSRWVSWRPRRIERRKRRLFLRERIPPRPNLSDTN
jgi:hypothetical protein